ncbi:MAG TPA: methyltransferase domain-containing protein, partial [Pirellulales bacterium]|nr:methyltransferase domain-containing protein [Pirellulales bacterium]
MQNPDETRPFDMCADWRAMAESLRSRFVVVDHVVPLGGRTYELLKPRSPDELIDEAEFNCDQRLPYWADVWPSALALAERVADEAAHGRRFLELGCGVGYVCAVAAQAGFDVLATDYYADALIFTVVNAHCNGLRQPATRLVDWRELPVDLGLFDVVVAADVLYERTYPALIAAAIKQTLAPGGLGVV